MVMLVYQRVKKKHQFWVPHGNPEIDWTQKASESRLCVSSTFQSSMDSELNMFYMLYNTVYVL
jgi:hypothetical protein